MTTPTLETERLVLRQVRPDDTQAVFQCWMNDENVSKYMWWRASSDIRETEDFVQRELTNVENDTWFRWILESKTSGEIIGTCLIYFNDEENNWDISYNLGQQYWGMGYATEAMRKVMEYAIEVLKIKECIASHAIENPASGRIIQKLGFMYEKDVPYECNGGEWVTTGKFYRYRV